MTSLIARPNLLAIKIEDQSGKTLESRDFQKTPELAGKLTYFELVQLHRANKILFPQNLYQKLTSSQQQEWESFSKPGTSEMWPGKTCFSPVAKTHDQNPFVSRSADAPYDRDASFVGDGDEPSAGVGEELSVPGPAVEEGPSLPQIDEDVPEIPEDEDAQQLFIEAEATENQLVYAPPGTGKSHALIERLARLSAREDTRILVLSFSVAVVKELESRLRTRLLKEESGRVRMPYIKTFDSFASQLMSFDSDPRDFIRGSYEQTIKAFVDGLKARNLVEGQRQLGGYTHLFVDEIQDLTSFRAEMVMEIAKFLLGNGGTVTGLGDWGQAVYDWIPEKDEAEARRSNICDFRPKYSDDFRRDFEALLDYYGVTHRRLTKFWRYTNPDLELMAHRTALKIGSYGDKPSFYQFREEIRRIKSVQRADIGQLFEQSESLAILARSRQDLFRLKHFLSEQDIPAEIHRGRDQPWPMSLALVFGHFRNDRMSAGVFDKRSGIPGVDPVALKNALQLQGLIDIRGTVDVAGVGDLVRNQTPSSALVTKSGKLIHISTIHKSKGLEFPHVVVLEPDWHQIGSESNPEEARIIYVAVTRGTSSVSLLERRGFSSGGQQSEKYPMVSGGRGVAVDGMETIDAESLLRKPNGAPETREGLDAKKDALMMGLKQGRLDVLWSGDDSCYWLTHSGSREGLRSVFLCALEAGLSTRLKNLPGNHGKSPFRAELRELATVGFDRGHRLAADVLGPALLMLAPLLSGIIGRQNGFGTDG